MNVYTTIRYVFVKVGEKLNNYVLPLFGLLLASFMFLCAAKRYRRSLTTNTHSGTNLYTNPDTDPNAKSEMRVQQTKLQWTKIHINCFFTMIYLRQRSGQKSLKNFGNYIMQTGWSFIAFLGIQTIKNLEFYLLY